MGAGEHHGLGVFPEGEFSVRLKEGQSQGGGGHSEGVTNKNKR